jgi:hypothetical protein
VHLVQVETAPGNGAGDLTLEHAAFSAKGMAKFLAKLDDRGEHYRVARIEDVGITQVNVWDPDCNHLHIDFSGEDGEG